MTFDEHENGQLRLGAEGDQLPLLPLPDAGIPESDGPPLVSAAVVELARAVAGDPVQWRLEASSELAEELEPGRYAVKCDGCRGEISRTDDVGESAAGGYCDACRVDPDVVGEYRAGLERARLEGEPRPAGRTRARLERLRKQREIVAIPTAAGRAILEELEHDGA